MATIIKGTRKIFLSAGHGCEVGKQDCGAIGNGYIEGVLAVEFRDLLNQRLIKRGVTPKLDGNSNLLAEALKFFKPLVGTKDIAVDIHWNAGPETATGAEVLVPGVKGGEKPSETEVKIANGISSLIATTLGIKNRGLKTEADSAHQKLGWMRLPCENFIIEICFISNKTDMIKYQENKELLADVLADYLLEAIKL